MSAGTLPGREAEVAEAVRVLSGDAGGRVAVVGAAGIGKSALVREVSQRMSDTGVAVRTTVGAASESDLPFVGLHDLIGADVRAGSVDLPETLRDALEVTVLRARPPDADVDPLALNLAVLRVVEHLSTERRLLLVLDDLPWIDAASRSTLQFVLRRVPPARVAILLAMRPDAPEPDVVAAGSVRTVAVGPLDPTALTAAVELGVDTKLPHRVARQVHDLSGGNPLLALELVRSATWDLEAISDLAVPQRYGAILAPRLEALSSDGRRSLLAASLLSRPTLEELADTVSIDGILEAEAAGVVRVEEGRVAFTHPLFAALCREAAPSSERRHMHALLAKAALDEVEQARHLGSATLLPDEGVATVIEQTAERARSRAAIAAAAQLMLLAERVTPTGDVDRRTGRACAASELFLQTGDTPTAVGILRRLLGELEPGPLRARCLLVLSEVTGEDTGGAAGLLKEALRQPGLSPRDLDEIHLRRVSVLFNLGDLAASGAAAAELEPRLEAAGRRDLARLCRLDLALCDVARGSPPARSRAWQQMTEEVDDYEVAYDHPDLLRAWDAMSREDHERASELLTGLMDRARLAGNIGLWASFGTHRSEIELRHGNVATAVEFAERAYRVLSDGRHDEAWLCYRALARAWDGRLDQAHADATEALAMARGDSNRLYTVLACHALGFIELSAGRVVPAAQHYDGVVAGLRGMGWRHPSLFVWQGDTVEAFVGAGRRSDAVPIVDELAACAEHHDLATSRALAGRCRALVLEDEGDLEAAATALDDSLELSEPLEIPLEHARTLLVRGVVHRRRRQKALSRTDLRRARDIFTRHGAVVWAARAGRELERSSPVVSGEELTGAERRVADLAAAGSTNREIAAALYLSEKTVEAVLTRVYRKLSVRSRAQLGRHPALVEGSEGRA